MTEFQREIIIFFYFIFMAVAYCIKITFLGIIFFILMDYFMLVYNNVRDGFKKK